MSILRDHLEIFSRIRGVRSWLFSERFAWRKCKSGQA